MPFAVISERELNAETRERLRDLQEFIEAQLDGVDSCASQANYVNGLIKAAHVVAGSHGEPTYVEVPEIIGATRPQAVEDYSGRLGVAQPTEEERKTFDPFPESGHPAHNEDP